MGAPSRRAQAAGPLSSTPAPKASGPIVSGNTAIISISGVLFRRRSFLATFLKCSSYDEIRDAVRRAVANPTVRQIVVNVDSPGGEVIGAHQTFQAIRDADRKKPVTAVIVGMGASAAFWIVSGARRIVAEPLAEVGSVGVVGIHVDHSKSNEKGGVKYTVIAAGRHKREANPYEPLSSADAAAIQRRIDLAYSQFAADVALGRRSTPEAVRNGFGEGRLLAAEDARDEHLIDAIDTLDRTILRAGHARDRAELARLAASVSRPVAERQRREIDELTRWLSARGLGGVRLST